MPYREKVVKKNCNKQKLCQETKLQHEDKEQSKTQPKQILYWLDYQGETSKSERETDDFIFSFHRHDIMTAKTTPKHLKSLLKRKYGKHTTKVNDESLLQH